MRRLNANQAGFEAVSIIIVLLFVGVVSFAGYKVLNMTKSVTDDRSAATSQATVPRLPLKPMPI